jgi:uncharacterized protein with FMN-binding domain
MKKSIVVILAVAMIGALGLVAKAKPNDSVQASNTNSVQSASTSTPEDNTASDDSNTAVTPDNSSSSDSFSSSGLKDGTYTGKSEFTVYGTVQIAAVVSGGKITDIKFLQMPGPEGHSKEVTAFAEPFLKDESIGRTNANIQFVSGATQTSEGYQKSLQAALDQAA